MRFRKQIKNQFISEEILDQASKCKSEELEELLNRIQMKLEQNNNKYNDRDLLRAKTIITSRLASIRSN